MTTQQLECFMKAAECLNFTRAAEELFISQPAVSRQISMLEKELNLTLFDRHYEKTKLTDGGALLYDFFAHALAEYYDILHAAQKLSGQESASQIVLGILSDWTLSFLPLQESLRAQNIDCRVEMHDFRTLITMLRDGALDLILTMDIRPGDYPDCHVLEICHPREVILFSSHHALAEREEAEIRDFQDEVFLVPPHLLNRNQETSDMVRDILRQFGLSPEIRFVPNRATMLEYVRRGLGVCLNIAWAKECTSEDFRYICIDHTHPVSLVWKKTNESAVYETVIREMKRLFNRT